MSRQDRIEGVRQVLDFLEANEDFPWPISLSHPYVFVETKDQARQAAYQLGNASKFPSGEYLALEKKFGPGLSTFLTVYVDREQVCRKVVTGTKHVDEKVIEAHDQEIIEWICDDPLLKPVGESS